MKPGTLAFITGFIFLLTLALPIQLGAQHTRYKLIDIGTFGGPVSYIAGNETGHRQLNNRGIVAGTADISTPDPNVANPDLCLNPDCFLSHAFQWQNDVLTDLGTLAGFDNFSEANVINERGWISGSSQTGDLDPVTGGLAQHAVLWKDGEIIDLGTLGGNESGGYYINNEGQVVGASAINTTFDPSSQFGATTHPFLWENGVMLDLGTLGGPDAFPRQWLCKPTQRAGRRRLEYKLDSRPCYWTIPQSPVPLGERPHDRPRQPRRQWSSGMREQPRSSHWRIKSGR